MSCTAAHLARRSDHEPGQEFKSNSVPMLQADAVEVGTRAVAVPDANALALERACVGAAADEPQQLLSHPCMHGRLGHVGLAQEPDTGGRLSFLVLRFA